jgi:N-glycosidase YbiA
MTIYFYTPNDEYGCFSNFSRHGIFLDEHYWPTVEHYFQAQKFLDAEYRGKIAQARTPKDAKTMGWNRLLPIRADWDEIRDDVMRRGVQLKFETHAEIRAILLATGTAELVENAPSDYYWGCGADGTGQNRLGKILMEIRSLLQDK